MNLKHNNLKINVRAKTFNFASLFFKKSIREDIKVLYSFCRYIDDLGDDSSIKKTHAIKQLNVIKKSITSNKSNDPIIKKFQILMRKYHISLNAPLFLISAIKEDLEEIDFKNYSQLINYSFKVAGTVGLMMCKIMKTNSPKLNLRGIQLGIAMQMTNICRDIKEDLERGRIYIPKTHRTVVNKGCKEILHNKVLRKKMSKDIEKLIDNSNKIYSNAWNGILDLPLKFSIPIAISCELYKEIGEKIKKDSCQIWERRVYVNLFEKIVISFKTFFKVILKYKTRNFSNEEKKISLILNKLEKSVYEKKR